MICVSNTSHGDRKQYLRSNASYPVAGLIFRSRRIDDFVICDYCQYYKCDWLGFSPKKYPERCPEARELQIADSELLNKEFRRRTELAKRVGMYRPDERRWFLNAEKARGLSATELQDIMAEIRTWSTGNKYELSTMVKYEECAKNGKQQTLV